MLQEQELLLEARSRRDVNSHKNSEIWEVAHEAHLTRLDIVVGADVWYKYFLEGIPCRTALVGSSAPVLGSVPVGSSGPAQAGSSAPARVGSSAPVQAGSS